MNDDICFLFHVWSEHNQRTFKCAVKLKRNDIPKGFEEHTMHRKYATFVLATLPTGIRELGKIVEIDRITEVLDLTRKEA